jgi:hypothetical protein
VTDPNHLDTIGTSAIPFAANADTLKLAVVGGTIHEKGPMLFSKGHNEALNWINKSLLEKVMTERKPRWQTFDLDKMEG